MLRTERIHPPWSLDDVFGDGQWCPVCHGTEFVFLEGHGIFCCTCNAEFKLRATAGDPGVVVDCLPIAQDGRFVVTRPVREGHPGDRPYFWQVLKECESGLADRDKWCTDLDLSDLGEHRFLHVYRSDPPMGQEVFWYTTHDLVKQLAYERWLKRTPKGRALRALTERGCPDYDADREGYKAFSDEYRRLQSALWAYERRVSPLIEQRLREAGHEPGYYLAGQCERIFADDGFYIHRCIPKPGEKPVRPLRRS
jgi:hypothetical protein